MQANRIDAYNLIHNGILAFARAEQQGMRIDTEYCERKVKFMDKKIKYYQDKFSQTKLGRQWKHKYGNKYNTNSDAQLRNLLYKTNKLTPYKLTNSGEGTVDEESLSQLDIDGLDLLIKARKYSTVKNRLAELNREQVNGFVHPFLNLHLARTYRPSTDRPNLANIPKRDKEQKKLVRNALYPRKGHQLLEVDFSGIEVMVAACYHKDPNMIKYITNPKSEIIVAPGYHKNPDITEYITNPKSDMHGDVAAQIFMIDNFNRQIPEHKYLRDATKNCFVFPQFYGDYHGSNAEAYCKWLRLTHGRWKRGQGVSLLNGDKISDHLIRKGIKTYDAFVKHIEGIENDFWNNRFAKYGQWRKQFYKKYQRKGYFDTYTGFRCTGIMRRNEVVNYPIQGSAFHCLLWCFIEIDRIAEEEQWESRLVNQIYDSMIIDVRPDELEHVAKTVYRIATVELPKAWEWIIVPLEVKADLTPIDGSWADKESYKLPEVA